jgi:hypothetical protein
MHASPPFTRPSPALRPPFARLCRVIFSMCRQGCASTIALHRRSLGFRSCTCTHRTPLTGERPQWRGRPGAARHDDAPFGASNTNSFAVPEPRHAPLAIEERRLHVVVLYSRSFRQCPFRGKSLDASRSGAEGAHTLDQMAVKDQRAMQARRFSALPTGSGAQRTTARFDGDRALPRCRGNGRGAAHRMRHGRLRALLVGDAQDPTQRRRRPGACATKRQPPGSEPAPPPCAHLTDQLSPLFWRRDRGRWTLILRIASAARRSG